MDTIKAWKGMAGSARTICWILIPCIKYVRIHDKDTQHKITIYSRYLLSIQRLRRAEVHRITARIDCDRPPTQQHEMCTASNARGKMDWELTHLRSPCHHRSGSGGRASVVSDNIRLDMSQGSWWEWRISNTIQVWTKTHSATRMWRICINCAARIKIEIKMILRKGWGLCCTQTQSVCRRCHTEVHTLRCCSSTKWKK